MLLFGHLVHYIENLYLVPTTAARGQGGYTYATL